VNAGTHGLLRNAQATTDKETDRKMRYWHCCEANLP